MKKICIYFFNKWNCLLNWLAKLPNKSRDFFYENLGISACFHLFIVVFMISSFFVSERVIVAPERIQIIDVDLSNVKITKDKTVVSGVHKEVTTKKDKGQGENSVIKEYKHADEENLVMTVNRNSKPLLRNMTISVNDAFRVAMSRCWRIDASLQGIDNIKIVAHISMRRDGYVQKVWYDEENRAFSDRLFARVLDSVKSAISVCQPFTMLPLEMYDEWKDIELTFYPLNGVVQ